MGVVDRPIDEVGGDAENARLPRQVGSWADMETSVNTLIEDLLWPTAEVTRALAAVAQGDLAQTMRLDVDSRPLQGEFLRSATIVNSMIKQLSIFTSESRAWPARSAPTASSAARPRCRT